MPPAGDSTAIAPLEAKDCLPSSPRQRSRSFPAAALDGRIATGIQPRSKETMANRVRAVNC